MFIGRRQKMLNRRGQNIKFDNGQFINMGTHFQTHILVLYKKLPPKFKHAARMTLRNLGKMQDHAK